jgi:DNA-binding MarR family transcriptional regulator
MPLADRPLDNDVFGARIVLTEEDAREAARLFRLLAKAVGIPQEEATEAGEEISTEVLVSRARIIFHSRLARTRHFNRAMFGEPAWDIMLMLYINDRGGSRLTATKIADLIEQPFSSVVRWIDYLAKERLIERLPHPNDKRVSIIALREKGRDSIETYLGTVAALNSL